MEVGGTLQDSVMSYQLMHMYTDLQCRHSGGFTPHKISFRTELHTWFERGQIDCTITYNSCTKTQKNCAVGRSNPELCHVCGVCHRQASGSQPAYVVVQLSRFSYYLSRYFYATMLYRKSLQFHVHAYTDRVMHTRK